MRCRVSAGTRSVSQVIVNSNIGVFLEFYTFQNIFSFIFSFDRPGNLAVEVGILILWEFSVQSSLYWHIDDDQEMLCKYMTRIWRPNDYDNPF